MSGIPPQIGALHFSLRFPKRARLLFAACAIWAAALHASAGVRTFRGLEERFLEHRAETRLRSLAADYYRELERRTLFDVPFELVASLRYFPDSGKVIDHDTELETEHWMSLRVQKDFGKRLFLSEPLSSLSRLRSERRLLRLDHDLQSALYAFRKQVLALLRVRADLEHVRRALDSHRRFIDYLNRFASRERDLYFTISNLQEKMLRYEKSIRQGRRERDLIVKRLVRQTGLKEQSVSPVLPETLPSLNPEPDILEIARRNAFAPCALEIERESARYDRRLEKRDGMRLRSFVGYRRRRDAGEQDWSSGSEIGLEFRMPFSAARSSDSSSSFPKQQEAYFDARKAVLDNELEETIKSLVRRHDSNRRALEDLDLIYRKLADSHPPEPPKTDSGFPYRKMIEDMKREVQKSKNRRDRARTKIDCMENLFELCRACGTPDPSSLLEETLRYPPAPSPEAAAVRPALFSGVWVWTGGREYTDTNRLDEIRDFCERNRISEIYLSLNRGFFDSRAARRAVSSWIRQMTADGITVTPLLGDPHWILVDDRENLFERIDALGAFDTVDLPDHDFTQIHLDIEPQALPDWKSKRVSYLEKLVETVRSLNIRFAERDLSYSLVLDIPVYFDTVSRGALESLFDAAGEIVLMAYGIDDPERLFERIRTETELSRQKGIPFRIALRAGDFSSETLLTDFASRLRAYLVDSPFFAGFSIHEFDSWKRLKEKR